MKRRYEALLEEHFKNDSQMAFVAGPRQVGKTTTCTAFDTSHYLRTKDKREVDFIVSKNGLPWFIVEAKYSQARPLSKSLEYFQARIGAKHAFQVVADARYKDVDCFEYDYPIIVTAQTFLSQLV
jgi:predicted AAA+ superfamily ATPase